LSSAFDDEDDFGEDEDDELADNAEECTIFWIFQNPATIDSFLWLLLCVVTVQTLMCDDLNSFTTGGSGTYCSSGEITMGIV
jgi:hypothetical protein